MNESNKISVKETALILGKSTRQVRRYLESKKLIGHYDGWKWHIYKENVNNFLIGKPQNEKLHAKNRRKKEVAK